MLLSLVLHGWISQRWEGFSLLTLLIGYRAVKYSSWNEEEINALLTLDCKWTTNPWAGLLFILQLCKPPSVFFFSTRQCQCVYTNIFSTDKIYNLSQIQALIRVGVHSAHVFFLAVQTLSKQYILCWWSPEERLWIFISIDWLASYRFMQGCLANTLLKFLLSTVLGCGLCVESHHFKNGCQCHSSQTILWACYVFWTLVSAYLNTVTELQLWSQKSLSLFHIYFVSLIT